LYYMKSFFFQSEDGIRGFHVTGVQTCALPISTRMPEDLSGRQVYVLDPMLATGGTLVASIQELIKRGADDVTAVVLLAAPEGVEVMERELAGTPVTVVTAAVDQRLNEHGYIVPGLGDAGDRMYGAAE